MTMKMSKLALAIGALVMAGGAMAQTTASANGTAKATVIAPITIAAALPLEFGNIVKGTSTGTVTIAAATGIRTDSIPALTPGGQKGTMQAGTFTITGEKNFTYSIVLPGTGEIVLKNGDIDLEVDTFTVVSDATNGGGLPLLSTLGAGTLKVGATLHMVADQAAGAYSGIYPVIVSYN